jgi:hypothetical protein
MRKIACVSLVVVLATAVAQAATGARKQNKPGTGSSATPAAATSRPANGTTAATKPAGQRDGRGELAAMRRAAEAKKHLLVFVYEKNDDQMRAGRKTFDSAVRKLGDAVQATTVDRTASADREFVATYGLNSAPMPAVLVFAPNGAIAGGFVGARLTEASLLDSLASPAKQACLKALQERKLVFLCVRSGAAKSNDKAMKGVNEFKADDRFAEATEIVKIDLSDAAETKFLAQLEVDPKVDQVTTVFLAPPSALIGKYTGATEKSKLVAALQAASAGGCSGKSGCCPTSK